MGMLCALEQIQNERTILQDITLHPLYTRFERYAVGRCVRCAVPKASGSAYDLGAVVFWSRIRRKYCWKSLRHSFAWFHDVQPSCLTKIPKTGFPTFSRVFPSDAYQVPHSWLRHSNGKAWQRFRLQMINTLMVSSPHSFHRLKRLVSTLSNRKRIHRMLMMISLQLYFPSSRIAVRELSCSWDIPQTQKNPAQGCWQAWYDQRELGLDRNRCVGKRRRLPSPITLAMVLLV